VIHIKAILLQSRLKGGILLTEVVALRHVEYCPHGVCAKKITFDITDDNKLTNLRFYGGCKGNLSAIAKVIDGYPINKIITLLDGNPCGNRDTSCTDQLVKAIKESQSSK
jgi:uncharacterized protein (TIGR03905 family)